MDRSVKSVAKLQSQVQSSSGGIQSAFANLGQMSGLTGLVAGITGGLTSMAGQLGGVVAGLGLVSGGTLALGAAALGAAGALHMMASSGAEAITTLYDTANNLNLSTDALQAFSLAPGLEGIGGISGFLVRLQGGLENITPAAQRAYNAMQVDVEALKIADAADQIRMLTVGYGNLQTQGERVSTLRAIGGRGGVALMDLLEQGADGLAALEARSERFGLAFSNSQAQAVRMANIEWSGFFLSLKGIGIQAAILFVPMWEAIGRVGSAIGETLVSAFRAAAPWISIVGQTLSAVFDGAWKIASGFFEIMWEGFKSIGRIFGGDILMDWIASWGLGWDDIREFALQVFATISVASDRLGDMLRLGVTAAQLAWAEFMRWMSNSWSTLIQWTSSMWADFIEYLGMERPEIEPIALDTSFDADIERLREAMTAVNASLAADVSELMDAWRAEIEAAGQRSVAPEAPATPSGGGREAVRSGAALAGSQEAFTILNSQRGTQEDYQRSALAVAGQTRDMIRDIRQDLRRSPPIRRAVL